MNYARVVISHHVPEDGRNELRPYMDLEEKYITWLLC